MTILQARTSTRIEIAASMNLAEALIAETIRLRQQAPAGPSLDAMPEEPAFDFVFLDADKTGYPDYYEQILPRMKPNALLLIDNILMGGDVVDPEPGSSNEVVARLNERIAQDDRVDVDVVAEGLEVGRLGADDRHDVEVDAAVQVDELVSSTVTLHEDLIRAKQIHIHLSLTPVRVRGQPCTPHNAGGASTHAGERQSRRRARLPTIRPCRLVRSRPVTPMALKDSMKPRISSRWPPSANSRVVAITW